MKYYIEIKENEEYVPYLLFYGCEGAMSGVYWVDDQTIHYLREMTRAEDGSKYWIGYSAEFHEASSHE